MVDASMHGRTAQFCWDSYALGQTRGEINRSDLDPIGRLVAAAGRPTQGRKAVSDIVTYTHTVVIIRYSNST